VFKKEERRECEAIANNYASKSRTSERHVAMLANIIVPLISAFCGVAIAQSKESAEEVLQSIANTNNGAIWRADRG